MEARIDGRIDTLFGFFKTKSIAMIPWFTAT